MITNNEKSKFQELGSILKDLATGSKKLAWSL